MRKAASLPDSRPDVGRWGAPRTPRPDVDGLVNTRRAVRVHERVYTDADVFAAGWIDLGFAWIVAHESEIPSGDYKTDHRPRTGHRQSRRRGVAHVLRRCRHRGRLCREERNAVVQCPYHGWVH
jgi:phenylpropionate dioxygenase-like ring-hydroxylating dioxygenase large terminal subunit